MVPNFLLEKNNFIPAKNKILTKKINKPCEDSEFLTTNKVLINTNVRPIFTRLFCV